MVVVVTWLLLWNGCCCGMVVLWHGRVVTWSCCDMVVVVTWSCCGMVVVVTWLLL